MSTSFRRHFAEYQRTEERTPQEQHLDSQLQHDPRPVVFRSRKSAILRQGPTTTTPTTLLNHGRSDIGNAHEGFLPSAVLTATRLPAAAPEEQLQHAFQKHNMKTTYIFSQNDFHRGHTRLLGTDKIKRDPHIGFMVHSPLSHMSCKLLHQPNDNSAELKLGNASDGTDANARDVSGTSTSTRDRSKHIFCMDVEQYIREHARNPHVGLRHAPPTNQYNFPGKDGVVRLGKHAVTRRATLRRQRNVAVGKNASKTSPVLSAMTDAGLIPNRSHTKRTNKRRNKQPLVKYIDEQDEYRMMTESLVTGVARTMIQNSNMEDKEVSPCERIGCIEEEEELDWPEEPSNPVDVIEEDSPVRKRFMLSSHSGTPNFSSTGTPSSVRSASSGDLSPGILMLPQPKCPEEYSHDRKRQRHCRLGSRLRPRSGSGE